jgi:hypothetical protein
MRQISIHPGMGLGKSVGRSHCIGLGAGNKIGHIDIYFWIVGRKERAVDPDLPARSDARELELVERLSALLREDPQCQEILVAELKDRTAVKRKVEGS